MQNRRTVLILLAALLMIVVLLEGSTVSASASGAIELCIRSLIPSLFPLLLLSIKLNSMLAGMKIPALGWLRRFTGIPEGSETLLLLGLTSGYPVGAQMIDSSYKNNIIPKETARRMLSFCNNAGPAFLIGFGSGIFTSSAAPWLLWAVHMLSACLTGFLLPGKNTEYNCLLQPTQITFPEALNKALKAMATICGWIIIFRVLISLLDKWFLHFVPPVLRILLISFLELTNGFLEIQKVSSEAARFIIASVMSSVGGVCVYMQTVSSTSLLPARSYIIGKMIQAVLSFILSTFIAILLW